MKKISITPTDFLNYVIGLETAESLAAKYSAPIDRMVLLLTFATKKLLHQ